jgi:uncharacterized protein with PQ loop repeat
VGDKESAKIQSKKSQTPTIYSIIGLILGVVCFIFTGILIVILGVFGYTLGVQAIKKGDKLGYIAFPVALLGWIYALWLTVFVV